MKAFKILKKLLRRACASLDTNVVFLFCGQKLETIEQKCIYFYYSWSLIKYTLQELSAEFPSMAINAIVWPMMWYQGSWCFFLGIQLKSIIDRKRDWEKCLWRLFWWHTYRWTPPRKFCLFTSHCIANPYFLLQYCY